ncbi:MAG: carboxylesterase family protein [Bryobacteraceae bacterium]
MTEPTQLTRRDMLRLGIGLASASALAADVPIPVVTKVVKTTNGDVQGLVQDGVQVLKGIRYGAPPVGPLRFMPPAKPKPWKGVADATEFGAPAIQMAPPISASPATDFGRQLASIYPTPAEIKIQNEDCLFLNVWTPGLGGATRRPVMVWLHGGGYAYGSGAWPIYDGANLAKKGGVVVVTVNHRLNVFGYLYLGQLGNDGYAKSGNAGMLDLVAALEWVRDNIEAFGGDPGNVTIMGESGGGAKVSTLLAMPAAKGLFHKAVIQSGPVLRGVPKEGATRTAKGVLDELHLGAADPKALQSLPAEDILAAAFSAAAKSGGGPMGGMMRLAPVVDGVVLPSDPFTPAAPEISANIPILIGSNKDEMTLFTAAEPWFGTLTDTQLTERAKPIAGAKAEPLIAAFRKLHPDYSPTYLLNQVLTANAMFGGSITLAERKAAQKAAPVYMYYLIWDTPVANGLFKSPHTLDIPFMFDNVDKARVLVGPGAEPEALARQMSGAWLAFARTGDPNWPAYTADRRATMLFDVHSRVADDPNAEIRKILES